MENVLTPTAIFHKGKLLQIGDLVKGAVEYLGKSGFDKYGVDGRLKRIEVYTDTLCNSLYLSAGATQTVVGSGLSVRFIVHRDDKPEDEKRVYAYEFDMVPFPTTKRERQKFISDYYNHDLNKAAKERLLKHLPTNTNPKRIGHDLPTDSVLWRYLCATFDLRSGNHGEITPSNMSDLTFKVLGRIESVNITNGTIYKLVHNK